MLIFSLTSHIWLRAACTMWTQRFKSNFISSTKIKEIDYPALNEKTRFSTTQVHIGNFTVYINQIVSRDINFTELSKDSGGGKTRSILHEILSVPQCLE